jgi:hypothetical protein
MTESVMFFGIGFFVAALLGLLIDFNGESDVGVRAIAAGFHLVYRYSTTTS